MQFIKAVIAIAQAVPIINSWIERLVAVYVASRIAHMKKENTDAIRKAITDQDQRDIEKVIGSSKAGELSGVGGTEVRDSLPGVKP